MLFFIKFLYLIFDFKFKVHSLFEHSKTFNYVMQRSFWQLFCKKIHKKVPNAYSGIVCKKRELFFSVLKSYKFYWNKLILKLDYKLKKLKQNQIQSQQKNSLNPNQSLNICEVAV